MNDLIILALQGRATRAEQDTLQRWRVAAPENDGLFRATEELWDLVRTAAPDYAGEPPSHFVARAVGATEGTKIPVGANATTPTMTPSAGNRTQRTNRRLVTSAIAASVTLAAFVAGSLGGWLGGPEETTAAREIVTGTGEMATVTLSDGTGIRLGPRTKVTITRSNREVVVWLEGRAFFGVERNRNRAFTVRTQHGEATALGTRFEVRSDYDDFEVLVLEGDVRVRTARSSVELNAGLRSHVSPGAAPTTSRIEDPQSLLDWMGQAFVFRETSLESVLSEVGRRYGVDIELEEEAIRDVTVTATFTDQPVESVLAVICQLVGSECEADGEGRFRIHGGGPVS